MDELITTLTSTLGRFDPRALADVLIVAAIAYWLMSLIQGTTAVTLIRGMVILLLVGAVLGNLLQLTMLNWLLRNSIPLLLLGIPILFQPELRRALEQVGRAGGILPRTPLSATSSSRTIDTVATAARRLAERHWGGLIVLERGTALGEYAATGVAVDGALSVELLLSIFFPNSPLHDGAVIVRGDRVLAAACTLPLSDSQAHDPELGTRHRAAIGITQQTDAVSVVVSEETSQISLANNGRIVRNLDEARLRRVLAILSNTEREEPGWFWRPRKAI